MKEAENVNNEELDDLQGQIYNLEQHIHDLETAIAYLINMIYSDKSIHNRKDAMENPRRLFSHVGHNNRVENYSKMIGGMGGARNVFEAFLNFSEEEE